MSHIDRAKFKWGTSDGRSLTADEIVDEHLANIVYHVKKNKKQYGPNVFYLLCFLREECERRGLGSNFIDGAPHPYTDANGVLKQGDEVPTKEIDKEMLNAHLSFGDFMKNVTNDLFKAGLIDEDILNDLFNGGKDKGK